MGIVDGVEQKSIADKGLAQEGLYKVEEVQYLNRNRSYNIKPNINIPTYYTPALRNHEHLSYGGGNHQGQRSNQNYQHNYNPLGFQGKHQGIERVDNQGHKRSQSFEEQMLNYIAENKRMLNLH